MLASCVLVTLALYHVIPNVVALLGVMLFVFFFEIGLGAFCGLRVIVFLLYILHGWPEIGLDAWYMLGFGEGDIHAFGGRCRCP